MRPVKDFDLSSSHLNTIYKKNDKCPVHCSIFYFVHYCEAFLDLLPYFEWRLHLNADTFRFMMINPHIPSEDIQHLAWW